MNEDIGLGGVIADMKQAEMQECSHDTGKPLARVESAIPG